MRPVTVRICMHPSCGPLGLAHAPRNCASPILLPYFRSSSLAQHDTGIRTVSSNWCLSFHTPSSFLFHIPGSESFTRLLVDMSVCKHLGKIELIIWFSNMVTLLRQWRYLAIRVYELHYILHVRVCIKSEKPSGGINP